MKPVGASPTPLQSGNSDSPTSADLDQVYRQRLNRYVTAMRNEKPDCIPIRPFVAEFTARYCGYTCQQVAHDYRLAFEAVIRCARDFDWDAVVPNMVAAWTGMAQAAGLRYYGIPGIGLPADVGFNYIEPPQDQAFMRADEYDALAADPPGYLYNVWLPRVSTEIVGPGQSATYRGTLALVKSAMAMRQYFDAFGPHIRRLREECGTPPALAGIFKAPLDIIADKLRGYLGLTMDLFERPHKVLAACEALMPHLCQVGLTTADPEKHLPIGFWMHRGCVPFLNPRQFASHYWPTLKPIIEEFWKHGHQTLFYAEGRWHHHFDAFRELPDRSIVFHCDRDDIFEVHRRLHDKFALSGGIPNVMLSFGQPEEVRAFCTRVIREVAHDGGYIMDAGAIMQNDTCPENLRAMTEVCRDLGTYSAGSYAPPTDTPPAEMPPSPAARRELCGLGGSPQPAIPPGICMPWTQKAQELPEIMGDRQLVRRIWDEIEGLASTYIWQLLLAF